MSAMCALAIASTSPRYQAPTLREFLQRYVSNRVFFGVSMVLFTFARSVPRGLQNQYLGSFTLEFHLPYYVLRQHDGAKDDPRRLRRCGTFISDQITLSTCEFLYEAQISFVIVGIDEWVWTAYCCTERYFGSEESIDFYYERSLDAPTGGTKPRHFPLWNPREYYLFILSLRIQQVTKEWSNLVQALEERLRFHVCLPLYQIQ